MLINNNEKKDEVIRKFKEENTPIKILAEEFNVPASTIYTWLRTKKIKEEKSIQKVVDSSLKKNIENLLFTYDNEINYCENRMASTLCDMKNLLIKTENENLESKMVFIKSYVKTYEDFSERKVDLIRKKGELESVLNIQLA